MGARGRGRSKKEPSIRERTEGALLTNGNKQNDKTDGREKE